MYEWQHPESKCLSGQHLYSIVYFYPQHTCRLWVNNSRKHDGQFLSVLPPTARILEVMMTGQYSTGVDSLSH
jgi:hypothetical protein